MGAEAAIGGALIGGIAGSQGRAQANMSETGQAASRTVRGGLRELNRLAGAGANRQDVREGAQSQRDLATMLQQYSQGGFLPSQTDFATAGQYAQDIFAPERQAVLSGFTEQNQRVAQMAARLGRPVNDPILQSKLATAQQQQLGEVGARQTAFRAQTAQQLPLQRLGFSQALTDVRQGLASQAFANRQMLVQLGNQVLTGQQADREARSQYQSPGFAGFLGGALGGAGSGLGLAGKLGGGGGASGGVYSGSTGQSYGNFSNIV